jgi:uncharacterized protein (DUF2141 family)
MTAMNISKIKKESFFKICKMLLLISCLGSTTTVTLAQGSNLTVKITNIKNNKGACRIWLYNSASGFPQEEKALKVIEVPITGTTSKCVFTNLPSGTYAISAMHDENGNHKFDTNFIGIPKERYGNSNGARGSISGPPSFEKCSIVLGKVDATVTIKVE